MAIMEPRHIALLKRLPADHFTGKGYPLWSKQYWFTYFWKEAVAPCTGNSFANNQAVLDLLNELVHGPGEFAGDRWEQMTIEEVRRLTWFQKKSWEQVDNYLLFKALLSLMKTGFKCVPKFGAEPESDMARYTLEKPTDRYGIIGWRGDTRSMDQLKDKGLTPKATAGKLSTARNMRAEWHPFSNPIFRNDLWYRVGQADNCTETVVSVSTKFEIACVFPQLEELLPTISNSDRKVLTKAQSGPLTFAGAESAAQSLSSAVAKYAGFVTVHKDVKVGRHLRLIDTAQLYLVLVEGEYFDTGKYQCDTATGSFPEVGVSQVKKDHILGVVSIVRIHHGLDNTAGFTALFDADKTKMIADTNACRALTDANRGDGLFTLAKTVFDKAKMACPLSAAWSSAQGAQSNLAQRNKSIELSEPGEPLFGGSYRITQIERLNGSVVWSGGVNVSEAVRVNKSIDPGSRRAMAGKMTTKIADWEKRPK